MIQRVKQIKENISNVSLENLEGRFLSQKEKGPSQQSTSMMASFALSANEVGSVGSSAIEKNSFINYK